MRSGPDARYTATDPRIGGRAGAGGERPGDHRVCGRSAMPGVGPRGARGIEGASPDREDGLRRRHTCDRSAAERHVTSLRAAPVCSMSSLGVRSPSAELPEDGLAAYGDDGEDLMLALARKMWPTKRATSPGACLRQGAAGRDRGRGLLVDAEWRAPEPVAVEVTADGDSGRDEAAEPQRSLFCAGRARLSASSRGAFAAPCTAAQAAASRSYSGRGQARVTGTAYRPGAGRLTAHE